MPELCDSSHMRIRSGFLNSEDAIELTEQYNVKVVVVWARRLQRLTVFLDYVEANFTLIWEHKPENESIRQIYVREIT